MVMIKISINFNKLDACSHINKTLQQHKQFIIQQKLEREGKRDKTGIAQQKGTRKRSPLHLMKQKLQKQGQLPFPVDLSHHACESVSATLEPMNAKDSNVRPIKVYKIYYKKQQNPVKEKLQKISLLNGPITHQSKFTFLMKSRLIIYWQQQTLIELKQIKVHIAHISAWLNAYSAIAQGLLVFFHSIIMMGHNGLLSFRIQELKRKQNCMLCSNFK